MKHADFGPGEYAEATTVVAACAAVGAIVAHTLSEGDDDWTVAGALMGALIGMAINWQTRCPVCMASLESGATS